MRKLAIASCAFSAAVFAAHYMLPPGLLYPLAAVFAAGFAVLLTSRRKWLRAAEITLAALAFGLLWVSFYSTWTDDRAQVVSGESREVEARLLDHPAVYEDYCAVTVRLYDDDFSGLKALLYVDGAELTGLRPGQRIRFTASLRSADTRYGEEYDPYYAKGIYLIANARSELTLLGTPSRFAALPAQLRAGIGRTIQELFPADTAGFMKAILLGDKDELYENVPLYVALNRAGLMHVAAVSGLHLSFLAALIRILLGKTRLASLISIPLLWLFALVTGGSPSALRAAFMLTILLLAPVVRRENDVFTSLSTILALILLGNPYAAGSISLQLSFGAVAGILCFHERISRAWAGRLPQGVCGSLLRYPLEIVAVSLSVMIFTLPLTALHFATVTVLSPLSNVLGMWAVSLCFAGGLIACAIGSMLPPVGALVARLGSVPVRYLFRLAETISELDFSVVYLDNPLMWSWLLLTMLLILVLALTKLPTGKKLIFAVLLSALLLAQTMHLATICYRSETGTAAVLDVGQGQSIAVYNDKAAVVIDCGGLGSSRQPGQITAAYLLSRGVRQLDALLLTHLHSDHANGAQMLMELLDVKTLYLPAEPVDEEDLLPKLQESAERNGTALIFIDQDSTLSLEGIRLAMWKPAQRGDANERCVTAMLTLSDYKILITGDAPIAAENELAERHDLGEADLLIVGHHGSRNSTGKRLLEAMQGKTAVISTGYNTFGHPTWETLERLAAYDIQFYRTDLNGTVEIRP